MIISKKRIFNSKIVAFCIVVSMVMGMFTGFPQASKAAVTIKTMSQLVPGERVKFLGMKGDLNTTWTYCGKNSFESDKPIGNMSADTARKELIKLESSVAPGLHEYLNTDPFGAGLPDFLSLYAKMWNWSEGVNVIKRNGVQISLEDYFEIYDEAIEMNTYLSLLPAEEYYEVDSKYMVSSWFNTTYDMTYPSRVALTSSACNYYIQSEKDDEGIFYTEDYYYNVSRNADGTFNKLTSGGAPVYPAISFNSKGMSNLHFYSADGVYVQMESGTFIFDPNGGTGAQTDMPYYYGAGQGVEVPEGTTFAAPRGMIFKGWSLTPEGETVTGFMPEGSVTRLYAIWEQAVIYEIVDGKKILKRVLPDYKDDPYIDPDTDVIAKGAFDNCVNIKNVTVPYNVSEIEEGAFQNIFATTEDPVTITIKNPECNLSYRSFRPQVTRIVSLAGSTADKLAKEHEELEAVSITSVENTFLSGEIVKIFRCPDGVEALGGPEDDPGVLEGHSELVTLDLGKVKTIGARAFKDCEFISGTLVIPSTVEDVAAQAFQHIGADKVVIESETLDPAKVAATGKDNAGITFEVKPPAKQGGGSDSTGGESGSSEKGSGEGSGKTGGSTGDSSGSGSGYTGGSGYAGGGSSGSSSSGTSGDSSGSGNKSPDGNGITVDITPVIPVVSPVPATGDTTTPGTSVTIVNDPGVEDEITPPVVIEKIVTDISNISDAAELNGIKVKKVTREGKRFTVKIKKKTGLKYQIRYTMNRKSWKGSMKKKFSKSSVSVKGLKSGKKYYFSIRAYKVVDGKKIYGKWSKRRIAG